MKKSILAFIVCSIVPYIFMMQDAYAIPSYARQTGEDCIACHVGGFGPQLTAHGMKFKLGGFTDTDGKSGKVPLSMMLIEAYTHTNKSQTENAQPHFGKNNNLSTQELSLFLAGGLNDHVGSFVQTTWNDIDKKISLDNVDVRVVNKTSYKDKDWVYGVSFNNNPTTQDPFNSLSSWRFPYTSSEFAVTPNAGPLIDGGLGQSVMGASAYSFFDSSFYAEVGGYQSLSQSILKKFNNEGAGRLTGTSPYWRFAYFKDMKKQSFHVGIFGMNAGLQPEYVKGGPTDKYRDIGIDGSYQFLGTREHIATVNGSYTHEKRKLNFSSPDNSRNTLNRYDLNATYQYKNTYGLTAGLFGISGSKNQDLYNTGEADFGSANASPNSRGYIIQADYTPWGKEDSWMAPWANVRLGLQYTGYTKFNGAKHNYDGFGRDASDNNTLFGFVWMSM